MKGLVSIIVPVYQAEKYLKRCIESLICQTYKNIEIILVDDGSTDNSRVICDEFARNDSRIKLISQKNNGVSAARNKGLENISGEYVIFVDSDDWIDTNTCEKAVEAMSQNDVDVVFWSYTREYPDKSLPRYIYDKNILFEGTAYKNLFLRLLGETTSPESLDSLSSVCNKCYKIGNGMDKVRFVDMGIIGNEDLLYNVQFFLGVRKAYYLHNTFYHYRKDNDCSLTSVYREDSISKRKKLFQYLKTALNTKSDQKLYDALDKRIALDVLGQALNIVLSCEKTRDKIQLIRKLLNDEVYKPALKKLNIKGLGFHWKVYYGIAKLGCSFLFFGLTVAINALRSIR